MSDSDNDVTMNGGEEGADSPPAHAPAASGSDNDSEGGAAAGTAAENALLLRPRKRVDYTFEDTFKELDLEDAQVAQATARVAASKKKLEYTDGIPNTKKINKILGRKPRALLKQSAMAAAARAAGTTASSSSEAAADTGRRTRASTAAAAGAADGDDGDNEYNVIEDDTAYMYLVK